MEVAAAGVDESLRDGETPAEHVQRLALAKADAVARGRPECLILGADTVVVLEGRVFGKPADLAEASRMLRQLSGRWHEVLTGVALVRWAPAWRRAWVCTTRVCFRELSEESIREYCRRVNPLDKAGAYGIQEHGALLVAGIEGLYSNVVGLPVEEVLTALAESAGGGCPRG